MTQPASVLCRTMVTVAGTKPDVNGCVKISLMQYNILADSAIPNGTSGHNVCGTYSYCPAEHRYMDSRHPRIMDELVYLDPDIVTMQEVESEHFYEVLQNDMKRLGYESVEHLRYFDHIGLATFYKADRFQLLAEKAFLLHKRAGGYLSRIGVSEATILALQKYMAEASELTGVHLPPGALLARFQHRASGRVVCVGNVHISWKQFRRPVLQMLQAACFVEELTRFADSQPCLLPGDFNTEPIMPLYHLMCAGRFCEKTSDALQQGALYEDKHLTVNLQVVLDILKQLTFELKMESAYRMVLGKEPDVTSSDEGLVSPEQTGVYKGCLDYIWYTPGDLEPVAVMDVPHEAHITQHVSLPSTIFPSDHIPLFAEFLLKTADSSVMGT